MRAAFYERQGRPHDVLQVGEVATPELVAGEVRIRVACSGVNPGDVKKRDDTFGVGMPHPRVIPHSDGAGVIEAVGEGVERARIGQRVWCFGAQSYRPFGTAAEFACVPSAQAVVLPRTVSFEQGACLGIPGITAHRAVFVAGPVTGRTVLVQGGAGAVGQAAIALARHGGARVVATVRTDGDRAAALRAGATSVVVTANQDRDGLLAAIRAHAPDGVDHVVEVAFGANVELDVDLLRQGGSIATYATGDARPAIPFWPLVFDNVSVFFLGSDDFTDAAKAAAAEALDAALVAGWPGYEIALRLPLEEVAAAHVAVEARATSGRVVVTVA